MKPIKMVATRENGNVIYQIHVADITGIGSWIAQCHYQQNIKGPYQITIDIPGEDECQR